MDLPSLKHFENRVSISEEHIFHHPLVSFDTQGLGEKATSRLVQTTKGISLAAKIHKRQVQTLKCCESNVIHQPYGLIQPIRLVNLGILLVPRLSLEAAAFPGPFINQDGGVTISQRFERQ